MRCAACEAELDAFTGDVCPHCQHLAHPTRLGIYDDLELIKRGGMGCVYRARHPELGTVVAIKTVQTHTGPETVAQRFQREARLAARIPHPGVVRVLDHDSQEGRLYLVMEYVAGTTLRQPIEADDRDLAWKLDKVAQLADVLQTAHERGIVHRDIKPENVMVDSTGRVRVLDFGIATILEEEDRLTQTGEILGTPEYIAPEQILDVPEAVDARTDVYAVGVVLYEMLTGVSPFAGGNLFQVLKNVESREPPPPSRVRDGIPAALDDLVMRCIAKDPELRPKDAGDLARHLRACVPAPGHPGPATASSRGPWIAGAAGIGVALGFLARGYAVPDPKPAPPPAPFAAIRSLLDEPAPPNRPALAAALAALPPSEPEASYWRGRALRETGSLLAAEQACAAARDGGFAPASTCWATLQVFRRRLLLPLLPGGALLGAPTRLDLPGDDPVTRALRALAAHQDAEALTLLRQAGEGATPKTDQAARDRALLLLLAETLGAKSHAVDAARIAAVAPAHDVVAGLLRARVAADDPSRIAALEATLQTIDRRAPTRYLIEMIVAALRGDEPRLRASLELCAVAGDSEFPVACYAASLLQRYPKLGRADRERLRTLLEEVSADTRSTLETGLRAAEQTHGR